MTTNAQQFFTEANKVVETLTRTVHNDPNAYIVVCIIRADTVNHQTSSPKQYISPLMAKACNEMNIPDLLGIMSALAVAHANRTIQNVRPNEQHTKELRDLEAALKETKSG